MQTQDQINGMGYLTDESLAERVSKGNGPAFDELTARYLPLIMAKASACRKVGLESDDLMQEGLLGLLGAAKTYDLAAGASFKTYAGVCIERRLQTACKAAARQKHSPLNHFVPLNDVASKDVDIQFTSTKPVDPEAFVINREGLERVKRRIEETLSGLEFKVLSLYLSGRTYEEIADGLCITQKVVDNALQRIRKKLRKTVS